MRFIKWAFALVFITFLAAPVAHAQTCVPYADFLRIATEEYQEQIIWQGTVAGGASVIIVQSAKGTWTLAQIVGGAACILGDGVGGEILGAGT